MAHHGERRQTDLFKPHKGMLYSWTDENLQKAEEKKLKPVKLNLDKDSTEYYSLYDRFHFSSAKKSNERLFRDIRQCDLSVNTSVAEQCNSLMSNDRSVICY